MIRPGQRIRRDRKALKKHLEEKIGESAATRRIEVRRGYFREVPLSDIESRDITERNARYREILENMLKKPEKMKHKPGGGKSTRQRGKRSY